MMISNSIKIIPMQKEHIKDITELERQCFSEPWSENALSEELSNTCAVFFAAIVDNVLAGYIGMHNICSQGFRKRTPDCPVPACTGQAGFWANRSQT